jgi:hypothetical protein
VFASVSLTCAATTVAVHTVVCGNGLFGVSVKLDAGEELREYATGVPLGHSSLNELVDAVTCSEKFTVTVADVSTPVAPFVGTVLVTVGGESIVNEKT